MKHTLVVFFLVPLLTFAQAIDKMEAYYYDFVKYGENKIYTPQENTLSHFFDQLDTLAAQQDRKVNVVHIGDSHIQADFFSNVMREKLLTEPYFGNGGRGFLFPYRLAHTNNPYHYYTGYTGTWKGYRNSISRDKSDYGLAGITAITYSSSSTFSVKMNTWDDAKVEFASNEVKVFYPVLDSTSFDVYLKQGDSLISGVIDSSGFITFKSDSLVAKMKFVLRQNHAYQTHFLIQGLLLSNDDNGIVYSSIGVNGAKIDSYLRSTCFVPHLAQTNADLVIISLGTNDAYNYGFDPNVFKANLKQLIEWIREACPNTSILLTAPGDGLRSRWKTNNDNSRAVEALLEIAQSENCALWDFYSVMGGLLSIKKWREFGLGQADHLHLTGDGYQLQGSMLYEALILNLYFNERQKILSPIAK